MRSVSTSQSGARSSQSMTTIVERSAGSRSMYQENASLARMYVLPVVVTLPTVASLIRPGQGPSSRARRRRSPAHGGRYGEKVARKAGPVGRDDVLAELRRVVDEAVAGRGHLLLAGEAGIGKTTMLTAAAGFAESRGVRVAWGWSAHAGRARALPGARPPPAGRRHVRRRAGRLVPLRQFLSPRTMVRLVGVGGFARLAFGQARSQRPGPHAPPQPGQARENCRASRSGLN